jgi:hypothetical protein
MNHELVQFWLDLLIEKKLDINDSRVIVKKLDDAIDIAAKIGTVPTGGISHIPEFIAALEMYNSPLFQAMREQ